MQKSNLIDTLKDWQWFILANSHILLEKPNLLFQQAANEPDTTKPAQAANRRFAEGLEKRVWFRRINKPKSRTACQLTIIGDFKETGFVLFSPNNHYVIAEGSSRELRFWRSDSGQELVIPQNPETCWGRARLLPDGRLVTLSRDRVLKIWNANTGQEISALAVSYNQFFDCTLDGRLVVSPSKFVLEDTLMLWDATTGKDLHAFPGHSDQVFTCAFSPDGSRLVSGSKDKTLKIWDAESGKELATLAGHYSEVTRCLFSTDGRTIVSTSFDDTQKIWDAATGKNLATLRGHTGFFSFSPKGNMVASSAEDSKVVRIWELPTGREICRLKGHTDSINACAFSPDGLRLATASGDKTLKLWEADTGKELATLSGHSSWVNTFAFSADGCRLVSGTNTELKIWDLTQLPDAEETGDRSRLKWPIIFSPNGSRIVSACSDKTLRMLNTESGKEEAVLKGHTSDVRPLAFSLDGRLLVSASKDKTLRIWDGRTGKEIKVLSGHGDETSKCAFSPAGDRIVSTLSDHTIRIWDTRTGKELTVISGYIEYWEELSFSPDGKRFFSFRSRDIWVWDSSTGSKLAFLKHQSSFITEFLESTLFSSGGYTHSSSYPEQLNDLLFLWDSGLVRKYTVSKPSTLGPYQVLYHYCFSADGSRFAVTGEDHTFKIGIAHPSQEIVSLKDESLYTTNMDFSPDGQTLILATRDRILKLWGTNGGKELAEYCLDHNCSEVFWSPNALILAAATDGGLNLFKIENLPIGPILQTAWLNQPEGDPLKSKTDIAFNCPHCRTWAEINESILGKELACPRCTKSVKLNTYTIQGDWRSLARAWK